MTGKGFGDSQQVYRLGISESRGCKIRIFYPLKLSYQFLIKRNKKGKNI
jgi:hypothetical protein